MFFLRLGRLGTALRHFRLSFLVFAISIAAVPHAYRSQLERRPELEQYFIAAGRGREVERAKAV